MKKLIALFLCLAAATSNYAAPQRKNMWPADFYNVGKWSVQVAKTRHKSTKQLTIHTLKQLKKASENGMLENIYELGSDDAAFDAHPAEWIDYVPYLTNVQRIHFKYASEPEFGCLIQALGKHCSKTVIGLNFEGSKLGISQRNLEAFANVLPKFINLEEFNVLDFSHTDHCHESIKLILETLPFFQKLRILKIGITLTNRYGFIICQSISKSIPSLKKLVDLRIGIEPPYPELALGLVMGLKNSSVVKLDLSDSRLGIWPDLLNRVASWLVDMPHLEKLNLSRNDLHRLTKNELQILVVRLGKIGTLRYLIVSEDEYLKILKTGDYFHNKLFEHHIMLIFSCKRIAM